MSLYLKWYTFVYDFLKHACFSILILCMHICNSLSPILTCVYVWYTFCLTNAKDKKVDLHGIRL